jgi:hypothetical protein
MTVLGLMLLGASCSGQNQTVRPDEMSAEAHLKEADKQAAAAQREVQQANSPASQPNLAVSANSNPQGYYYPTDMYNPKNQHLLKAQQLTKHAQAHESAAAYLASFEVAECKEFPPATRAACPLLGPVTEITDVPGGIRARFVEGTRVDAVAAHMRCHFAYAQSRGFDTGAGCPLYIRGIEIRTTNDPRALEIVGRDASVTAEIRNRSREEAVMVHGGSK